MSAAGTGGGEAGGLRVFINYRRDDTSGYAGLLYDALSNQFGESNVFMDVDKLELGLPFAEAIERELATCDVLIALIGREWLGGVNEDGRRRLEDPADYVRREIVAALQRNIRVIPVLAEGVKMPAAADLPSALQGLVGRHAFEMAYGARWRRDRDVLLSALDRVAAEKHGTPGASAEPAAQAPVPQPKEVRSHRSPSPKSPPRARSRRRIAFLCGCVLAVAAAGGVGAFLATRGSSGTSTMSGTGFPDAIEDELLLAHVPESIRASCVRAPVGEPGVFLRSVRCSPGGEGGTVTYSRAHSVDALRATFLQRAKNAGAQFPTKWSCQTRRPAADEWARAGLLTHVENGSKKAEGRVLCYADSDRSWIVWTDTPTKILAVAAGPSNDFDSHYRWWRMQAGPEKELGMNAQMKRLGRYPDAIEQELLVAHVPSPIKDTCVRSEDFDINVFLRSVTCSQGMNGQSVQYSYAHSGTALKAYADTRATAAGIEFPTGQTCRASRYAADTWMRVGAIGHRETSMPDQGDGRVLCFENSGTAWMEWTDVSTGLYGSAQRPVGERRALYRWWQDKAGPGSLEGEGRMHMEG